VYAWLIRHASPEQRENVDQQLNAPIVTKTGKAQPSTPMTEEQEGELFMTLLKQTGG
jgi:hypothetical protein